MSDQAPNQITAAAPEPGPNPMRRMLRDANASLNGPKPPDVGVDAGSSSVAIDRRAALLQAAEDDILFTRGGEVGRLGSLSVHAETQGQPAPTIRDARPDWARPAPPQVAIAPAAETPLITQG